VSHDLRAPLNATMINADFVLQLIDEGDTGQAAEVASRIQDNVRHMSDMVTGLLKLSRSGRTALKVRTVDTRELVDSLLEDLEDLRQTETEVRVGDLPAVQGDAVLLRSVFQNLIMNAVKFSRASNPPRVEIEWCEDGAEAFFRIRDNGVGFDPAKAEKLFKVFSRLHRQKDYEGTGVGLAIVQRIVSRHGGRVWAESKPGEGASFCFTLGVVEEDG
jgi:signal transduction histidine kinase